MDRARIVAQDAPYDPWPQAMTVSEETSCYTAQKQGCGDKIPTFGARGRSPASAVTQWQLNQPSGLAYTMQSQRAGIHKAPRLRQRRIMVILPLSQQSEPPCTITAWGWHCWWAFICSHPS